MPKAKRQTKHHLLGRSKHRQAEVFAQFATAKLDGSVKLVRVKSGSGAKVRVKKHAPRSSAAAVIEQRVYGTDGRLKTIYTVDAGSATFGSDLGYAFKKNVAKARRENKTKFGSADALVGKG